MTRDEIIRMAREAGPCDAHCNGCGDVDVFCQASLLRFAALVAAAETERCAGICEAIAWSGDGKWFAARIREGGHVSEP